MQTDRSRIIAFQRCPRERYWAYHHLGTGIQRKRKSLPLQFGSAFHEGSETLLTGAGPDLATARADQFLQTQFTNHFVGFDGETPDDAQAALEYGVEEQTALAEALLRGWWAFEGETFLEQYEVIEMEKEGRAILQQDEYAVTLPKGYKRGAMGEWYDLQGVLAAHLPERDDSLILLFRPDALVRERATGDLYIVSWKTCATFGKRNVDQARHDMQSMSEVWGVEQELRYSDGKGNTYFTDHIEGVLYKWIVKGFRRKDNWDGLYKQSSHLIYGWRKLGNGGGDEAEWSWAYEWDKEDGTGASRLGKGWKKVPIWREYPGGVKQWIEDLAAYEVFPRHLDALAPIFPQMLPVERRAEEVDDWKEQIVAQELDVQERLGEYSSNPTRSKLNALFPQWTGSCHSYSGCSFIPVCWEGAKPEPGELYQIRTANHPEKENNDE